jgi:hypothetical protein
MITTAIILALITFIFFKKSPLRKKFSLLILRLRKAYSKL